MKPNIFPNLHERPAKFWLAAHPTESDAAVPPVSPQLVTESSTLFEDAQGSGCHEIPAHGGVDNEREKELTDEMGMKGRLSHQTAHSTSGVKALEASEGARTGETNGPAGGDKVDETEAALIAYPNSPTDDAEGGGDGSSSIRNERLDTNQSNFAESGARLSMDEPARGGGQGRCSETAAAAVPAAGLGETLAAKNILEWTAVDVRTWLGMLPRGLAAFAEASAFSNGSVDGKRLASLTMSDLKRKEFHHSKFRAKVRKSLCAKSRTREG